MSEPDEGQTDALNRGIAMATGDIIGWLNSDDVFEAGCLDSVARVFAEEPETQWVYGKVRIIDESGREIRRWITRYKNFRMRHFRYSKLLTENWISQMGVFWRRSAGALVGPFRKEFSLAIDYDFWLRLAARWPGRYVDQELAAFRWYQTSISGSSYVDQTREALEVAVRSANGQYRWAIWWHRANRAKIVALYRLLGVVDHAKRCFSTGLQHQARHP